MFAYGIYALGILSFGNFRSGGQCSVGRLGLGGVKVWVKRVRLNLVEGKMALAVVRGGERCEEV